MTGSCNHTVIEEELVQGTVQDLYNTPHYNTDLDAILSCCGSKFFFSVVRATTVLLLGETWQLWTE